MFEVLRGFLTGYLHLDWDVEFDSPLAAATHFGSNGKLEEVVIATGEIELLSAGTEGEQRVKSILASTMCGYLPADGDCVEWIRSLGREMVEAAASRVDSSDSSPS